MTMTIRLFVGIVINNLYCDDINITMRGEARPGHQGGKQGGPPHGPK